MWAKVKWFKICFTAVGSNSLTASFLIHRAFTSFFELKPRWVVQTYCCPQVVEEDSNLSIASEPEQECLIAELLGVPILND